MYKRQGLGLALVATVVKQHGGTVAASSVENQGTTITVSLPIVEMESSDESVSVDKSPAEEDESYRKVSM